MMDDASLENRKTLATLEMFVFVLLLVLMLVLAGQVGHLAATSPAETPITEAAAEIFDGHFPYCYSECGFTR